MIEANAITAERFREWSADFAAQEAVPMIVIGCVIGTTGPLPREAIIIVNSQGRNDAQVLEFLRSVCSDLEARMQ